MGVSPPLWDLANYYPRFRLEGAATFPHKPT